MILPEMQNLLGTVKIMQSHIDIASGAMHVVYADLDGCSIKVIESVQWLRGRVLSLLFSDLFFPIYEH